MAAKKKPNYLLWIGGLATATGLGYVLYQQFKPKAELPPPPPPPQPLPASYTPQTPVKSPAPFDSDKLLKRGSQGKEVEYVQRAINDISRVMGLGFKLGPDGSFGSDTETAVKKVMNRPDTTYKEIQTLKIAAYYKKGLPHPYGGAYPGSWEAVQQATGGSYDIISPYI
jgi:hypothetical protein